MYCTTLNSYTGDSRAAFNILSLHQNRYLIDCCRQSQFSPPVSSWYLWYFYETGKVCVSIVLLWQLYSLPEDHWNESESFKLYDMLNHNAIQMNCSMFVFIFYTALCVISNMIESLVFSKNILLDLHFWWLWGQSRILCPWMAYNKHAVRSLGCLGVARIALCCCLGYLLRSITRFWRTDIQTLCKSVNILGLFDTLNFYFMTQYKTIYI